MESDGGAGEPVAPPVVAAASPIVAAAPPVGGEPGEPEAVNDPVGGSYIDVESAGEGGAVAFDSKLLGNNPYMRYFEFQSENPVTAALDAVSDFLETRAFDQEKKNSVLEAVRDSFTPSGNQFNPETLREKLTQIAELESIVREAQKGIENAEKATEQRAQAEKKRVALQKVILLKQKPAEAQPEDVAKLTKLLEEAGVQDQDVEALKKQLDDLFIPIHIRNNSKIINILTDIKDKIIPKMNPGGNLLKIIEDAVGKAVTAITTGE